MQRMERKKIGKIKSNHNNLLNCYIASARNYLYLLVKQIAGDIQPKGVKGSQQQ